MKAKKCRSKTFKDISKMLIISIKGSLVLVNSKKCIQPSRFLTFTIYSLSTKLYEIAPDKSVVIP